MNLIKISCREGRFSIESTKFGAGNQIRMNKVTAQVTGRGNVYIVNLKELRTITREPRVLNPNGDVNLMFKGSDHSVNGVTLQRAAQLLPV